MERMKKSWNRTKRQKEHNAMTNLYEHIGRKIRQLRRAHVRKDDAGRPTGSIGLSQQELANMVDTTANTISRWETAAYKPSAIDLHRLAQLFGVSISEFFPNQRHDRVEALLSATGDLNEDDMDEIVQYARFRKARKALNTGKKKRRTGSK